MCRHYKGHRNPPAHMRDEFSIRSNLYQLALPDSGFYPLATVPIVRLDKSGEREMVAAQWGDYDGSGTVDGEDFLAWQRQLGQAPSAEFAAARAFTANATQSAIVNAADLAVWQEYFGQALPPTAAVPEPASLGGACWRALWLWGR
jgi:hypothetical protein